MGKENFTKSKMISDFDLCLACEGTHRNLADILGARPVVNSTGLVDGYYFALWAPNAKTVSVVGDFNDWNKDASLMTKIPETDFWEIYIEGIQSGELYKYCIVTADDKVIYKADPMAKFAERRPKTASRTYFDTYHWHDLSWCIKHSTPQEKNAPMAIYEVHMGSWMRGQDNKMLSYSLVADALVKFLKENRYTHVEIMPLAEHPYDASLGYQATGYFAPTSRYGTPDEFKYFVDVMHQNSIGVILDWVPGHFPKDEHGLIAFDGTNLYEKNQEISESGTLKFNFASKMVRQFLISNALYWLKEFHVDGLRVDGVSYMLNPEFSFRENQIVHEDKSAVKFIKQLNTAIKEERPGAIMIADEVQKYPGVTKSVEDGGLGFDYNWNSGWTRDTLKYMEAEPSSREEIHDKLTRSFEKAFNEQYVLAIPHSECIDGKKNLLDKMNGEYYEKIASLKAYLGFMFAHPGKKMLFMGSEIGQINEWRYFEQLDWKLLQYETHRGLYQFAKKLLATYNDEPAFWQKDDCAEGFLRLDSKEIKDGVYSFLRKSEEETIAIFVNMTSVERFDYWVKGADEGTYSLLLNSDDKVYCGEGEFVLQEVSTDTDSEEFPNRLRVNLPPLSVLMYKKSK